MKPPRSVPSWDEYFMSLAKVVATRSKDPDTQHGAVVVDHQRRVVGTGYNGGSCTIPDDRVDWSRPNKYSWVIHAEENALWMAQDRHGLKLYVTGRPCSRCMLRITHSLIVRVVYGVTPSHSVDEADWELSQQIAREAGVELCEFRMEGAVVTREQLKALYDGMKSSNVRTLQVYHRGDGHITLGSHPGENVSFEGFDGLVLALQRNGISVTDAAVNQEVQS